MRKLKTSTENKNKIEALLLTIAATIVFAVLFDTYYDMNDDVLIKDILAGIYTGTPQGRNIQMLYPLAALISLLYRIMPVVPWFGLLLTGSIFLSFYLILSQVWNRLDEYNEKHKMNESNENLKKSTFDLHTCRKVMAAVLLLILYAGLLLWEMVFVQYTVVCGILAATAAVYLYLTPKELTTWKFIVHNIPAILLVVVAFNLRTEMLLLMSPFLAIAGLLRWSEEEHFFCKESFIRYGAVLGSIFLLLLTSFGINKAAYSSSGWHTFENFFDARTDVYDYTWYPDYDKNIDFYESNQISRGQYELICNYNFGLDERIDSDMLSTIAAYQKQQNAATVDNKSKIKNVLWQYRYQITHFDMETAHETRVMPYNLLVLILYVWMIAMAVQRKDITYLWKLPMMWIFRSVPWLYVLWGGRVVARLTHPMYLIEILIQLTCIFLLYHNKTRKSQYCLAVILIFVITITLPGSIHAISEQEQQRESVNTANEELLQYCGEHPQNYYYLDVYSTVTFSEKIFEKRDFSGSNYDLLGGWFSKSPYSAQKALQYGITDVTKDFASNDQVYFIAAADSDVTWITLYYQELGQAVSVNTVDTIEVNVEDDAREQYQIQDFNVYQIRQTVD